MSEKNIQKPFPIVGIGASAGGLAAFESFFSGMPADIDPGMAFVLVQHLAPDHKSILTDLISRYTRMKVFEVEDGMAVEPNCAYIIPPNRDMALVRGTLQLLEPAAPRGQRLPIDFFFQSLARDQHERAIGIVLSGTGSDGTLGVRAIKAEGGLVLAQIPESAEYDSMPRSAIATGLVDDELLPSEMADRLIAYATDASGASVKWPRRPPLIAAETDNSLKKIFVLLQVQTGHDFSQYKPSTIHRRIERRMSIHQIETIDSYVKYLQQTPTEVEAMFHDLLIGVTSFFRDPETFKSLEEHLPTLFADKPEGSTLRVWSPGCSTGEEAYSIAILLVELMETQQQSFTLQIFATDIDGQAIATARAGLYPATIAADVSPQRLARFFTADPDGSAYRIHKRIRDLLIFSEQDIIKDPPFSKLDLISCRNLMIYMGSELQKKLIPLFHYALNPNGMLLLGTSETVGDYNDLFTPVDRRLKLYRRKEDLQGGYRSIMGPFLRPSAAHPPFPRNAAKMAIPVKLPLRELTEQALLQQLTSSAALVNGHGDILYLHGRTGMFLEPTPGEAGVNNIVKMAREGLRHELVVAMHKVAEAKEPVHYPGLHVKTNGHYTQVNLTVRPLPSGPAPLLDIPMYLILFDPIDEIVDKEGVLHTSVQQESGGGAQEIATLRQELRAKEEYLQATNEELETSNEELRSSMEEMQSVNEELQSTNEELETSKEELQSVNEELATVNTELQAKLLDLSRANSDMNNLLAGTGIGTVFVDHQLRILRFTPTASAIINLIPSDVGRPVAHLVSNLVGYDRLVADTQDVLTTLIPKEMEVQTRAKKWYAMRIQPYRTLDNVIEGAVLTFVEITGVIETREQLNKANDLLRLAVAVRDAHDAITVQELDGRIIAWNPGAVRLYGWLEAEALTMNMRDRIPPGQREEALEKIRRLSQAETLEPCLTQRLTKDGTLVNVSMIATALVNEAGQTYAIATTERPEKPQPVGDS